MSPRSLSSTPQRPNPPPDQPISVGFIVSGRRSTSDGRVVPALVPVLAFTPTEAFQTAVDADSDFYPSGCISEIELKEQMTLIAELRSENPGLEALGFVVGGFVGNAGTGEEKSIAVLADGMQEAIRQAARLVPGFRPAGCLNEADIKGFLKQISQLRQAGRSTTTTSH